MICTLVLLSRSNGKEEFSEDCLKYFVKKNKVLKSQIGKITNIRYDELTGKVFGDIDITLRAATNGDITQRIETPRGILITEFRPANVSIFISAKK